MKKFETVLLAIDANLPMTWTFLKIYRFKNTGLTRLTFSLLPYFHICKTVVPLFKCILFFGKIGSYFALKYFSDMSAL